MASARTYDQIAYTALGAPAASITFSSIAASWTDLQLVITGIGASSFDIRLTFNGDTATNYSTRSMGGNRTAVAGLSAQSANNILLDLFGAFSGVVPTLAIVDVFQYQNTTPYKTVLFQAAMDTSTAGNVAVGCGLWRSTAAVTSITLTGSANFATGTTAALYGIKAA